MSPKYADIIINISHEAIDRTFQYIIPESLEGQIRIGMSVSIPFGAGNHLRKGYVTGLSNEPKIEVGKLKEIAAISEKGIAIESSLIELAAFIREQYGSTMINALKTVMPIKEKVRGLTKKEIRLLIRDEEVDERRASYEKKHAKAKLRLLSELAEDKVIPYNLVTGKLNVSSQTISAMVKEGAIAVEEEGYYRNVFSREKGILPGMGSNVRREIPNEEQQAAIDRVLEDYRADNYGTYLLRGITGSGKTLVYIEIIDEILKLGKQAIVLIPEIALTYQTVKRFRQRFGERVTIMNSRLSKGERYDQFEKAKKGDVSVIIGPRSALFAPFPDLGLIVIDEEHETTYKSDYPPKYHAREVAIKRAQMCGASVILGSATPSVESNYWALRGEYRLLELTRRANENARLAEVSVVDLREELKLGNRSMFSNHLKSQIADRLGRKEQVMLFLNRRGYAGFVSCRSCGHVLKCPHCDVSLTVHYPKTSRERLQCHYCGYETKRPAKCPECSSDKLASFGVGTEQVEAKIKEMFPEARVLRMDMDTTKKKGAHERILDAFANGQADILVGTQMIVKGHDFPGVTLVGAVVADTTLFENDYRASEKTFDLLTQAAGRAGRGELKGEVVIQTYQPDHYCIQAASLQDYDKFYEDEKAYRSLLSYPPFCHMMAVFIESPEEELTSKVSDGLYAESKAAEGIDGADYKTEEADKSEKPDRPVQLIGPCEASIYKLIDQYRKVIYLKHKDMGRLIKIKDCLERYLEAHEEYDKARVTFDFDPMKSY